MFSMAAGFFTAIFGAFLAAFFAVNVVGAFTGPSQAPPLGNGVLTASGTSIGVAGNLTVSSQSTLTGNTTIGGNMTVSGASTQTGNVGMGGNLTVAGTISGTYTGTMSAGNVSAGSFGSNTGGGNYSFPGSLTVNGVTNSSSSVGSGVYGATSASGASYAGVQGYSSASNGIGVWGEGSSASGQIGVYGSGAGIGVDGVGTTYGVSGYSSAALGSGAGGYFSNNGGGASLVTGTGNVGVGKANPGYPLDVNGAVNATQYCIAGANCITAWPSGSSSGTDLYLNFSTCAITSGSNLYSCAGTESFSPAFVDTNYYITCTVRTTNTAADAMDITSVNTNSFGYEVVQVMSDGGGNETPSAYCHLHHA